MLTQCHLLKETCCVFLVYLLKLGCPAIEVMSEGEKVHPGVLPFTNKDHKEQEMAVVPVEGENWSAGGRSQ